MLFGRYGYRRTSMDEIAREAGVAKATLYMHFAGKEDVFRAMAACCGSAIQAACAEAEAMDAPVQARLVALLDGFLGTAMHWFGDARHSDELRALSVAGAVELGPSPEAAFEERLRGFLVAADASRELDLGRLPSSPPEIARTILHAAQGAKHARSHTRETLRQEIAKVAAMACGALAIR